MLSIVLPIYNEETIIEPLYQRLCTMASGLTLPCEFIFVDDGSRDQSLQHLRRLQASDERILILELSRNWGHQAALSAGLSEARGDAVVLMDADLQDPPELIPEMVRAWHNGAQIVTASRREKHVRQGPRRWLSSAFYAVFQALSEISQVPHEGIFCLLDAEPAAELCRLRESNRYLPGLRDWLGYRSASIAYDRPDRTYGKSRQSLGRLVGYGMNAIFSFSHKPLRFILYLGCGIASISFMGALIVVLVRLHGSGLFDQPVVIGYTSTVFAVLFLGGIQLIALGLMCEYIGRIYDEVKARPLYIIRHRYHVRSLNLPPKEQAQAAQP